ncbi:unnamed protein product, partial [Polarella glacialis]
MLHGCDTQGVSVCQPCRLEAGPLLHLAAAKKGGSLLVGGHQALVTLELTCRSVEGDDSAPILCLEKRRNLTQHTGGAPRSRVSRCTGVCFQPESDAVAASGWADGRISLWDTVAKNPEPLISQWQAHKHVNALAFLPTIASGFSGGGCTSSSLVSAGG